MTRLRLLFAGTIFLGSFLLFLVEPIAARQLLPVLGGSAAVWITCLVFFQTQLLLGYLYAHWLSRHPRWTVHLRPPRIGHRRGHPLGPPHRSPGWRRRPPHPHRLRRPGGVDRPPVPHALRHQPAPPGMVGAPRNRPDPLSSLRPVQPRVAAGPRPLSHSHRTPPHPACPAPHLVLRIRAFHHSLRPPGCQNPVRRLPTIPHAR